MFYTYIKTFLTSMVLCMQGGDICEPAHVTTRLYRYSSLSWRYLFCVIVKCKTAKLERYFNSVHTCSINWARQSVFWVYIVAPVATNNGGVCRVILPDQHTSLCPCSGGSRGPVPSRGLDAVNYIGENPWIFERGSRQGILGRKLGQGTKLP